MVSVPKQLLIQAILILINGLFAAMEIAVISLNTTKLKKLEEEGDKSASKLLRMAENPSAFLSTIQIGISLAGFLGAAFAADTLAEPLAMKFIEWGVRIPIAHLNNICVVLITVILTFITIVFGELIPKRVAQQKSYELAKALSSLMIVLNKIFKPVIFLTSKTTDICLKIMHLSTAAEDENISEDDIRLMVDAGGESGTIEEDEQEMIQNIFEFNDIAASEIMTRTGDFVAIEIGASDEEIVATINDSGKSRFPVYKDDYNSIIGILIAREFLLNLASGEKKGIEEMLHPAYCVPESIKADRLFSEMQRDKTHMAIVIDEYGETSGLVTLEDLLESIVGNIYDESDKAEAAEIEKIGENTWKALGTLQIETLAEETGIDFPEDRDYDTLAGLVLATLSKIPEDGESFTVQTEGLEIDVTKVEDKRIVEAIVTKLPEGNAEEEETSEEEASKSSS